MRAVLATKNPGKLIEMRAILATTSIELVSDVHWDEAEETGATLEENALLKAHAACTATGLPAIADDTGLEVDVLGGAPGVHTARFSGPNATHASNRAALLAALDGESRRSARFRTVIALVTPEGRTLTAEGVVEGQITSSERGDGGFGYDSVFAVGDQTLAEMSPDEKNRISHRARALQAFLERWRELGCSAQGR